jgi:hypothetical protein
MPELEISNSNTYKNILLDVLNAAKNLDYSGYDKFDALDSRFLELLSLDNQWFRLIIIQSVMRCPFHIRPLFGVKKSRNPKGIALFARAYLFLYQKTGETSFLQEARSLLDWLLENPSPRQKNLCWGYQFIWQDLPPFHQHRHDPNIVVTSFVGEALMHAYRITGDESYLQSLKSIANFIANDLPVLHENDTERAISYIQGSVDSVVLNVQVMSAALQAKLYRHTGDTAMLELARKQMNYTINRRTDYGAWYYTWPHDKSYIRHDNYHTGGILDSILEFCEETGDDSYLPIYWQGLEYYKQNLFEADGAPRWMNDKRYPHDIHGAAQGIISFVKAGRHDKAYQYQAEKIAKWTIANLYRPEKKDFIYRKGAIIKWNYSLMRWCNAWMARALGELIQ